MKVAICAGPATTGKTSVLRHMTRKLLRAGHRVAFLKLDVQYADEDELLAEEFEIPTKVRIQYSTDERVYWIPVFTGIS